MSEYFVVQPATCNILEETPDQRLMEAIRTLWTSSTEYKRLLYVINSTGSGKTYCCIRVCEKMDCMYFLCGKSGVLSPTLEISELIYMIDEKETLSEKNIVAAAFVRLLEKCFDSHSQKELFDAQFQDGNYMGVSSLLSDQTLPHFGDQMHNQMKSKSPPFKSILKNSCSSVDYSNVAKKLQFEDDSTSINTKQVLSPDLPRVVFFDEADLLQGKHCMDNELCASRCIQRAIADSTFIGVFLSTTSRMELIESRMKSSRDTRSRKFTFKRFVEVSSHDLFTEHLFFKGRPLWRNQWEYRCDKNFNELIRFAINKLLDHDRTSVTDTKAACSLFCLRFGFEPVSESCSDFVSNHMAVMLNVNDDHTALCRWFSEPVLAEASACLTMHVGPGLNPVYAMERVVKQVSRGILQDKIIKPSVGDKGEVVVAALLGYTIDTLRATDIKEYNASNFMDGHHNMSCRVSAHRFLESLGVNAPASTKDYDVNFTHFVRLGVTMTRAHCYQAVFRCCGWFVSTGAKAVDMVLVGFKRESNFIRFMPIRLQIKNLASKITQRSASILLNNMSPASQCQPNLTDTQVEIGIVVSVGEGGADVYANREPERHSPRIKQSNTVPYHGYVLNINDDNHFVGLRSYNCGKGNEVVHKLRDIAQGYPCFEEDDSFEHGFRNESEKVLVI